MKLNYELLEKLVKEYKINKSDEDFLKIYKLINTEIEKKAGFLCHKLKDFKVTQKDICQELYFKIWDIINKYDSSKSFKNYFNSCLRNWSPYVFKEDKRNYESLYKADSETGEESEIEIEDKKSGNIISSLIIEDILNQCKTENEKKICQLYLNDFNITEEEIGKEMNMTHQNISLILKGLRKNLKYYLQK